MSQMNRRRRRYREASRVQLWFPHLTNVGEIIYPPRLRELAARDAAKIFPPYISVNMNFHCVEWAIRALADSGYLTAEATLRRGLSLLKHSLGVEPLPYVVRATACVMHAVSLPVLAFMVHAGDEGATNFYTKIMRLALPNSSLGG